METMFPAGRRSLPPVPRSTPGAPADGAPPSAPASDAVVEDAAQEFVSRLRGAAARFAAAAGAQSAIVREAVPPARHRRARCRVVLRYADRHDADLTFLGPVDRPGSRAPSRFDDTIREWFSTGQQREPGWLVADDDAPDGVAVDVTAWLAAG